MKNIEGYLAGYFEKKDWTRLTSENSTYRSKTGELAVYKLRLLRITGLITMTCQFLFLILYFNLLPAAMTLNMPILFIKKEA